MSSCNFLPLLLGREFSCCVHFIDSILSDYLLAIWISSFGKRLSSLLLIFSQYYKKSEKNGIVSCFVFYRELGFILEVPNLYKLAEL